MAHRFIAALVLCGAWPCAAWDTAPHIAITRAALNSIPVKLRQPLASEWTAIIEAHCMLPDRYLELSEHGFARKNGPKEASDIAQFCLRPDGGPLHSCSWDWEQDQTSLVFVLERILTNLGERRAGDAARFTGTLAHFIEDSLSPPHAVSEADFSELADETMPAAKLHAILERSVPAFDLGDRQPEIVGDGLIALAESSLSAVYKARAATLQDLKETAEAARAGNQVQLDKVRLRNGKAAAAILADTLATLLTLAAQSQ